MRAATAITELKPNLSLDMQSFVSDVVEDIRSYGTIPQATLMQFAQCTRAASGSVPRLGGLLQSLLQMRGRHYLDAERRRAGQASVVVTVEKL